MRMEEVKVLIIDDDEVIAQSTAEYFNMFDVKSAYVTGYDEAVEFLEKNLVSLLLLDINLGDRSGFELCRKVRENYDMPILFISARSSDDDVLIALNIGGDDYIKKPFTLSILLAKVKTILERYEKAKAAVLMAEQAQGEKTVHPEAKDTNGTEIRLTNTIILDTAKYKIRKGTEELGLKAMEFKLLKYLYENAGRVVTKEELLQKVWDDEFVGEGTLAVHIRHLREKIEEDPKMPRLIKTIWGVGYIMEKSI
ncbi:MAG: response regulator transcription factor [Lachnospiraceae bacterium]|nr:response regulator transcription factor [Lachnospiraceae bacterium]